MSHLEFTPLTKKTGSNGTFGEAFLSELKNNGIWDARLPLNHPFWGWWCCFSRYTVACRLSVCLSVTPFSIYPRCEPNYFSHNRQKKSLFLSFLPEIFFDDKLYEIFKFRLGKVKKRWYCWKLWWVGSEFYPQTKSRANNGY